MLAEALNIQQPAIAKLEKCTDMSECTGNGGFYYIQSLKMPKTDVHTKIDNDNLEWLKQEGKGYQARLNNVIRWARLNNCPITQL
jgi:uncharacterized protein (DUF4415 family)